MVDWFVNFAQTQFGVSVILGLVLLNTILGSTSWLIYAERKVAAFIQDRKGPNRVGPFGLIQPIADGIKMVFKEDSTPDHVDKPMFLLAPLISFMVGMITFAAIPWGGQWDVGGELLNIQVSNPDIGVLYILGVASVGVYGVVLGGWASNNKYSFLAAMRATAQMLSYEIPLGVCILVMVLTAGTLRLEDIVAQQVGDYWFGVIPQWNIFLHPIAFVVLFIAMLAEANRAPFDLAEAEQELVGGFHTEYGALKFGLFFLGEYAAMITSSALLAVLFFGGWHLPWLPWAQPEATSLFAVFVKISILVGKVAFFILVMMWIRWTLPRPRYDQLMRLVWQGVIPLTLVLLVLTVVLVYFGVERSPVWALGGNAVVLAGLLTLTGRSKKPVTGRQENMPVVSGRPLEG
jgi:NADH-quinone oxidoreductase subunit H